MKGVPVKSDNDRSRDVKSALAAFGFQQAGARPVNLAKWKSNVDLKVVDEWQSNLVSPDLKHFQVLRETEDEFHLAPEQETFKTDNFLSSFNKSVKDLFPVTAKSQAVQNEISPEDLKMQLLRENAILKDKSLMSSKKAVTKPFGNNDSVTSQDGSIAESAEPVFSQDAPVQRTKAGIQEWIKTQQKNSISHRRGKGFGNEIEPSIIYMASMAAAAATSAGLTSVNRKQEKASRVNEEESLSSNTAVKSPRVIRKMSKGGKRPSIVRKDSGLGATQSASDTDYKVAETNCKGTF
jgi:hypothetical protein